VARKQGWPLFGALLKIEKEKADLLGNLSSHNKILKIINDKINLLRDLILEKSNSKKEAVSNSLKPNSKKAWMINHHYKWVKRIESEEQELIDKLSNEEKVLDSKTDEINKLKTSLANFQAKIDILKKEKNLWEKKQKLKEEEKEDEETIEMATSFLKPRS
jgi:chromosome segregation ATPase